jgi:signal transduction histidine kinase
MRRFTFWAVALAVLVIVAFNIQGWLVLRRTGQALERELGDRLQSLGTTLAGVLAGRFDEPASRQMLSDVMQRNDLFNLFIVDENLQYLANAREPDRIGSSDPALEPDATEVLSAFSGIPTRSKLYSGSGYYLETAYTPLTDSAGMVAAVLGVEADARFFSVLAGFRNSLLLINILSLLAISAIVLVSVSLIRHALRVEQAAARANTMVLMGQMSGAVAHEIKNPLGIIRAAAERLQKRHGAEPELDYIKEEVDRLSRVITNYLNLGAAKAGEPETVNLAELISDVLASLGPETSRSGIKIEADLDHLPPVTGNRLELRQVFLNLVLNASQAQPQGGGEGGLAHLAHRAHPDGRIRVSGRSEQNWAVVRISDNGPGIGPHDQARIFEPFFTTREKGSGLGLFVVKRIVEQHQGQVTVTSKAGAGTTVEVRLPT